jgi:NNP family nitrate/nitrite transporter-like MFS transporter
VFASLFAPGIAKALGWNAVLGLAVIPLSVAFLVYLFAAQDSPNKPPAKSLNQYLDVLRMGDAWWFMFFYAVTFGGFVGLASSLAIYFNTDYGLDAVTAGYFTAACVFCGSLVRPIGGALADRIGGIKTLSVMYGCAALALVVVSFHPSSVYAALGLFAFGMLAFGMGNGSVFQLVPQRFRHEIGVMTGLVGMTGGIGGFFLASSLGLSKQLTGAYQTGLLGFASLAVLALVGLSVIKQRWRTTWGAVGVAGARI